MKKSGLQLKMVFAGIMAFVMLLFCVSFSVYAATAIAYDGTGFVTLIGTGNRQKELDTQRQTLVNCGLNAALSDGSVVLQTDSATGTALRKNAIQEKHNRLIEEGILSYIIYDNSICSLKINEEASSSLNLVVCLDFSNYSITGFQDGFLDGIIYSLMGSIEVFGYGNGSMTESTTNADGTQGPISYIDAATGTLIPDKKIDLYMKGIGNLQNLTSYFTIEGEGTTYIYEYSLHIVLPNNIWWEQSSSITFEANSFTVTGLKILGTTISVEPPSCIGVDLSKVTVGDTDPVIIDDNAAPETTHFHFIGMQNQMEYCLEKSFDKVLDKSFNQNNYVEEIFVKPYTNSHFTRGYAGVGKENGKLYVSVYDQPATAELMPTTRTIGILVLYYWLWFEYGGGTNTSFGNSSYITYRHYPRDSQSYIVQSDVMATLTFNGKADSSGWYYVYCMHNADATAVTSTARLVGSFRRVNNGDGTYVGEFRDGSNVALASD